MKPNLFSLRIAFSLCIIALPAAFGQTPAVTTVSAIAPAAVPATVPSATPAVAVAAKKPGVQRIGIVTPKAQLGQETPATTGAETLRTLETQYLRGPSLEIVPIAAMIPMQVSAEIKDLACDYVLYSSLSEKAASNSSFLKKAMPFAGMIPMAGALGGGMATMAAGSAASIALGSASGLAANTKAKTEMTFNYRLVSVKNGAETAVLENTAKAKAKQDGEDILSPMLEQAATAIVSHIAQAK